MKRQLLREFTYGMLVLLVGLITPLQAGMVVTDADREWVRRVSEEQALETVADANTLDVLDYRNQTGNTQWKKLGPGLAIMITTDLVQSSLSESGKIKVVERNL